MVFLAAIIFESLVLAVFALYSEWVLGELGIWAITVANAVSVGAMAWIAWRSHPGLQEQLPRTAPDV
jgi:O-antigen/teichoic acid export membrane protein